MSTQKSTFPSVCAKKGWTMSVMCLCYCWSEVEMVNICVYCRVMWPVCGLLIAGFFLDVDGMEKEFIWRTMSQFVLVLNPTCDFIWPPLLTQQSWPDLNNVSTQDRCVRGYLSACVCVSMCVWVRGHAWVMRKLLTCFHQNSSWTVRWQIHGRNTNSQPGYLSASQSCAIDAPKPAAHINTDKA